MSPAESTAWRAEAVITLCAERGWTLGVAESLTGGLVLADLITVPGASEVVVGGVVAYHPRLKRSLLDVPESTLAEHGTVSEQCALAMARGARRRLGVVVALATTGVAGPSTSEGHPVGTVHCAVSTLVPGREEVSVASALNLNGTRIEIRTQACAAVMSLLLDTLTSQGPPAIREAGGVR
ncbi:MAG: nicotinamide-nucleotide amidohydrolase family protein [Ornithinimicrobium sp.]